LIAISVGIEPFGKRDLIVVAVEQSKVLFQYKDINIGADYVDNAVPEMEFRWLDDNRIDLRDLSVTRFGPVEVDISTGKKSWRQRGSNIWLPHQPVYQYKGHFVLEFGKLYFAGQVEPICNLLDERGVQASAEITVDNDGQWAAFVNSKLGLNLVDGVKKSKTQISPNWCYDLKWLSPAP
jgi:hypothetical protein